MKQTLLGRRIASKAIDFGLLPCGCTPVDLATFGMDNGGTKKELVVRTYAGVDGYCPFAVHLGSLGYCLALALRPGVQHSARESQYNLKRALPVAAGLATGPLLLRADSGFCSLKLTQEISAPVKRRRIKTVMQEMMFKAARMIAHAGCWVLGHGASDSDFAVFDRHYGQLKSA